MTTLSTKSVCNICHLAFSCIIHHHHTIYFQKGVKDYAEQQKKLQKDISVVLERNRDNLHKQEAEARLKEEKRLEHERQLQEAAEDLCKLDEVSSSYIPSGDTVHRPKLLFLPQMCPEHELDSPVGGEIFFDHLPQRQSNALGNALTFPAGTDILSPQYCINPKATAKRIFSVTKVTSPTLQLAPNDPFMLSSSAASCVVNSPTAIHPPVGRLGEGSSAINLPHLCMPLPSVDIKTLDQPVPLTIDINTNNGSPNSLQKSIGDQTLERYIQQIVSESTADGEDKNGNKELDDTESENRVKLDRKRCTDEEDNCDDVSDHIGSEKSVITDGVGSSNTDLKEKGDGVCDNDTESKMQVTKGIDTKTEAMNCAMVEGRSQGCDTGCENVDNVPCLEKTIENVDSQSAEVAKSLKGLDLETDKQCAITDVSEAVVDTNKQTNTGVDVDTETEDVSPDHTNKANVSDKNSNNISVNSSDKQTAHSSPLTKHSDYSCDGQGTQKVVDDVSSQNVRNSNAESKFVESESHEKMDVNPDEDYVECDDSFETDALSDTAKASDDSEPWNPVNLDSVEVSATNVRPDFHTNLSINGLKQELASLIDEEVAVVNGAIPNSPSGTDNGKTVSGVKNILLFLSHLMIVGQSQCMYYFKLLSQ